MLLDALPSDCLSTQPSICMHQHTRTNPTRQQVRSARSARHAAAPAQSPTWRDDGAQNAAGAGHVLALPLLLPLSLILAAARLSSSPRRRLQSDCLKAHEGRTRQHTRQRGRVQVAVFSASPPCTGQGRKREGVRCSYMKEGREGGSLPSMHRSACSLLPAALRACPGKVHILSQPAPRPCALPPCF